MKPRVYWDGFFWCAERSHGPWFEGHQFDDWAAALEHGNWLASS